MKLSPDFQLQIQKRQNHGTSSGPRVQTPCKWYYCFPCSQVVWTKYVKSKGRIT